MIFMLLLVTLLAFVAALNVTPAELGALLFFLPLCFFFFTFLASQSADDLITAGTDTWDEAVQPIPLKVPEEKFFFLWAEEGLSLELMGALKVEKNIEEMVGFVERLELLMAGIGSVSEMGC